MANNANLVSAAKPQVAGAIYRADIGTTLPTDAVTTLDAGFEALGYVSEDGLTNTNSSDSDEVVSWDGDTVLTIEGNKSDTFKFTLLEVLNPAVLKSVYGDSNVSGTLATGITVIANSVPQQSKSWVVDMVMNNNVLKRIVIPCAKVTEVADIVYKKTEAVGYETTISAVPDSSGNTHYEYIKSSSASA